MCYHYSSSETQSSVDSSTRVLDCSRCRTRGRKAAHEKVVSSMSLNRSNVLSRTNVKRRPGATCFNGAFKTTMKTLLRALMLPSFLLKGRSSHYPIAHCGLSYSDASGTSTLSILGRISQRVGLLTHRAHSHNDYHQEDPLGSALQHGIKSVEVDVFPRNDQLWVGHTRFELDSSRTIENLYVEPILKVVSRSRSPLSRSDPRVTSESDERPFPVARRNTPGLRASQESTTSNHLMNMDDEAITLLVDFKADAEESMALLHKAIKPLHPYLSKVDKNGKFHHGKVTILVSGNRPKAESLVSKDSNSRFIFIDGRDHDLDSETDTSLVPMVSLPWRKLQLARFLGRGEAYIREKVQLANKQGKRLRVWGAPNREELWRLMLRSNVDLLSIDDHSKFATFASKIGFSR